MSTAAPPATPFGLAFLPLFDSVLDQLDEAARPVLRRCSMRARLGPQRDAAEQERISKKLKVAPTLAGDKYLASIRQILASGLGLKRSGTQVKFHESFLQACARILYRSDGAQADMSAIMEREQWQDLQQQVCCLTPRRFGKTTAVAMFAAAVAMSLPTVEIAIFSTGRRASSKTRLRRPCSTPLQSSDPCLPRCFAQASCSSRSRSWFSTTTRRWPSAWARTTRNLSGSSTRRPTASPAWPKSIHTRPLRKRCAGELSFATGAAPLVL